MDKERAELVQASSEIPIVNVVVEYVNGRTELYECESGNEVGGVVRDAIIDPKVVGIEIEKNLDYLMEKGNG